MVEHTKSPGDHPSCLAAGHYIACARQTQIRLSNAKLRYYRKKSSRAQSTSKHDHCTFVFGRFAFRLTKVSERVPVVDWTNLTPSMEMIVGKCGYLPCFYRALHQVLWDLVKDGGQKMEIITKVRSLVTIEIFQDWKVG